MRNLLWWECISHNPHNHLASVIKYVIFTALYTRYKEGPLARYVKLRVAHSPGMLGTFSPPPHVREPDMHQGTCVTHVPRCMPGSLAKGFPWSRWRGRRCRHYRCIRNEQLYVSGKRSMAGALLCFVAVWSPLNRPCSWELTDCLSWIICFLNTRNIILDNVGV